MFKKAERKQAKLKIGIAGPSGSGKTYSALLLAKGMGGKIALIDTEKQSSSLYADQFEFDICNIEPPYTTQKFLTALKEAEEGDYDIIIMDSISHQWAGEGGILNRKEQVDARGGNSFTNWAKFTPEHETFKAAIVNSNKHLICTLRSKQDYVMGQNDKGKSAPNKVGLAPVQREGMEYEFTIMFDVAMDHSAAASKDRTSLFDGQINKINEDTGKRLMKWLSGAKLEDFTLAESDKMKLVREAKQCGYDPKEIAAYLNGRDFYTLTETEFKDLRAQFTTPLKKKEPGEFDTFGVENGK